MWTGLSISLSLILLFTKLASTQKGQCGKTEFTARQGEIKTPGYPSKYPSSLKCAYVIKTDTDHEISLSFEDFHLESHSQCRYDFVTIVGTRVDEKVRYCGKNSPSGKNAEKIIKSRDKKIVINFSSDSSTNEKGFRVIWTTTRKKSVDSTGCGAEFNKETGILTSPGYPKLSDKRVICTWKITVPKGARIKFEFLDLNLKDDFRCSTGYVQLRDLDRTGFDSRLFCGKLKPRPIVSLGNVISVGYFSNKNQKVRGFRARWTTVYKSKTPEEEETLCSKRLTSASGEIFHKSAVDCSWLIQLAPKMQGVLSVNEIKMADDPECKQEVFEARDGRSSSSPLLFRTCGSLIPRPVVSTSNLIFVTHRVFKPVKSSRVKMTWRSVDKNIKNGIFNPGSCRISSSGKVQFKYIQRERGKPVKPAYVPWIVQLYSRVHCAGMIISPEWILSAAHCFSKVKAASDWTVRAGDPDFHSNDRTEQTSGIDQIHIHRNYNPKTFEHDIALVHLSTKLRFNENIKKICLPAKDEILKTDQECLVAGWGTDKYLSKPKEKLLQVFPKIASRTRCNQAGMYNGKITNNMICAGGRGFDTCQGDGGSPLVCVNNNNEYSVVGLSSFGNGCAGKYGVYTDIRTHLSWMKNIINNN